MLRNFTMSVRVAFAFAAGALFDLFVLRDAFSYRDRGLPFSHATTGQVWLALAFLFLCAFILNLRARASVLIPAVIVLGMTAVHTIVLIADISIDPTTHNLFPIEYIFAWATVGIPALAGALLAAATSKVFSQN
jgi:hypothetical protein